MVANIQRGRRKGGVIVFETIILNSIKKRFGTKVHNGSLRRHFI